MKRRVERLAEAGFCAAAGLSALCILAILFFLIAGALPFFRSYGLLPFLFGTRWTPDRADLFGQAIAGSYGILPMLVGTLAASLGALAVGGIPGVWFAVFLFRFCPSRLREPAATAIRLLASIPSVVYGFFGLSVLLPAIARFVPTNGSGLLATSLILGTMILPTVASLSRTALEAVPASIESGALALGVSPATAIFTAVLPAARRPILRALGLGLTRAMGETMAVILVSGNAPTFPRGLFRSFRVLTANVALEMGYAGEVQRGALIAGGAILLLLVLAVTLFVDHAAKKKAKFTSRTAFFSSFSPARIRMLVFLCRATGGAVGLALGLLIGFIMAKGAPVLLAEPQLLWGEFAFGGELVTLLPSLVATLLTVVLSIAVSLPISLMSAIRFCEYAPQSSRITSILRRAIALLGGVPSIIYGLFGMMAFLPILGGRASILAGSLTVAILLLPTLISVTEDALSSVAEGQREGSLALGASRLRTLTHVVLPAARPGILSAILLSIGRVLGESAPFLYTMGSVLSPLPVSALDSGTTLAVALYSLAGEGWNLTRAWGAAFLLLLLSLLLDVVARGVLSESQKSTHGGAFLEKKKNRRHGSRA